MQTITINQPITESILSDHYLKFTEGVLNKFPSWINTEVDSVPEIFKDYEYPVSSWPVLIDKEKSERLALLCTRLPNLLKKIPSLYFKNNIKKIAEFYFQENEMLAEFALMCLEKDIEVSSRLDLTFTNNGFKVLEINMGSSIGGFQIQNFEELIRSLHKPLKEDIEGLSYEIENTQSIYFNFLINQTLAYVPSIIDKEINVFIDLSHLESTQEKEASLAFFNQLLKKELDAQGYKGNAFTAPMTSLKLRGSNLVLEDKVIHSVIVLGKEEINSDVFRAFISNRVYLPDNLSLSLLGDKRNLALLREMAELKMFDTEDNELLISSIPHSYILGTETVIYNEKEASLDYLLINHKEQFVIKAARGYQGKDVFVGKFLENDVWEEAIKLKKEKDPFIVQEFCDSIDFTAPNPTNQWTSHKLIWGAFGFGKKYGGVWVRMSEVKTDVGVINSATGAVEAIVYVAN